MRVIVILLSFLVVPGVARAEPDPQAYPYMGLHGTGHAFDLFNRKEAAPEPAALPGLHGGYRWGSAWAFQGSWEQGGYELDDGLDGDLRVARVELRRHFPDIQLAGFRPYAAASVDDARFDPDPGSVDHQVRPGIGFGLKRALGRRWQLDLGGRETHATGEERRDGELYLGFTRRLGRVGPEPSTDLGGGAQPDASGFRVKDSDGDGVADPMDDCPGSGAGTEVDGTGCAAGSGAAGE